MEGDQSGRARKTAMFQGKSVGMEIDHLETGQDHSSSCTWMEIPGEPVCAKTANRRRSHSLHLDLRSQTDGSGSWLAHREKAQKSRCRPYPSPTLARQQVCQSGPSSQTEPDPKPVVVNLDPFSHLPWHPGVPVPRQSRGRAKQPPTRLQASVQCNEDFTVNLSAFKERTSGRHHDPSAPRDCQDNLAPVTSSSASCLQGMSLRAPYDGYASTASGVLHSGCFQADGFSRNATGETMQRQPPETGIQESSLMDTSADQDEPSRTTRAFSNICSSFPYSVSLNGMSPRNLNEVGGENDCIQQQLHRWQQQELQQQHLGEGQQQLQEQPQQRRGQEHQQQHWLALTNPMGSAVHLACWQGDYSALSRVLRLSEALTVENLEAALLEVVSVPGCCRGGRSRCAHEVTLESGPAQSRQFLLPVHVYGDQSDPVPKNLPPCILQSLPQRSGASSVSIQDNREINGFLKDCRVDNPKVSNVNRLSESTGASLEDLNPLTRGSAQALQWIRQDKGQTASSDRLLDPTSQIADGPAYHLLPMPKPNFEHRESPQPASCCWARGDALELAIGGGSLLCVDLLLAVLLLRKLLALKLLSARSAAVRNAWSVQPLSTVKAAMRELGRTLRPYVLGFLRLPDHLCTFALACLLGQARLLCNWQFVPMRSAANQDCDARVKCLLASAVLSGSQRLVHDVVLWHLPEMTGDTIASVCCLVLRMAKVLNVRSAPAALPYLASFHLFQDYNCIFLNFLRGMNAVYGKLRSQQGKLSRDVSAHDTEEAADEVCRCAGFLFDSSVLQRFALQVFDRDECSALDLFLLTKARADLPKSLRAQYNRVFMDVCRRGAAGSFLLALEEKDSKTLISLSPLPRQRLALCLLQYVRATERLFPTLTSSCCLCVRPLFSFLLWFVRQPAELFPQLSVEEISGYDRNKDSNIDMYVDMSNSTSRLDLCEYHGGSFLETRIKVPDFVEKLRQTQEVKSLKALALLCLLDNADELQRQLVGQNVPGPVRDFFYIEREVEGI